MWGTQCRIEVSVSVYTEPWRMALHPHGVLPLSRHFICVFGRQSHCSVMASCIVNGTVCNTTSGSHGPDSPPPSLMLWNKASWSDAVIWDCILVDQSVFFSPWIVKLAKALQAEKANLSWNKYLFLFILRMNSWSFQDGSDPTEVNCYQVVHQSPQGKIAYWSVPWGGSVDPCWAHVWAPPLPTC